MSREEVAALLGISPESVRSALRRYGVTEQRGYRREQVEALERPGRGARTDLRRLTITLDGGTPMTTTEYAREYHPVLDPDPGDGLSVRYMAGPEEWTVHLDGLVGVPGQTYRVEFATEGRTCCGTAEVEMQERKPNGAERTTLAIWDVAELVAEP